MDARKGGARRGLLTARAGSGAGCDGAVDSGPGRVSPRACSSRKSSSGVSAARRAGVLGVDDRFAPAAAAVGDECGRRGSGPGRVPDGAKARATSGKHCFSLFLCLPPTRRPCSLTAERPFAPDAQRQSMQPNRCTTNTLDLFRIAESCPGHGPWQEGARSWVVLDPELLSLTHT
jgi:hypothetical protein